MNAKASPWTAYRTLGDDALVFRLLIVLLLVLYSIFPPQTGEPSSWLNIAAIAVYLLITAYLNRRETGLGDVHSLLSFAGYALDISVITFTLYSLSAWESDLYLTYVIAILLSAKAINLRHTLFVGLAVCAAYSLALFASAHALDLRTSSFLIRFPFLVIVSAFTMHLSQRLEKSRDARQEVHRRLRETNEGLEDKIKARTRDLGRALSRLQLINDLTQSAMPLHSLDELWPMLSEKLKTALSCERVTFFVQNENGSLTSIFADGLETPIHLPLGKGIAGCGSRLQEPLIINDPYNHPDFVVKVDVASGFRTRNILACPLLNDEEVRGVVELINKEGGFTQDDTETLLFLAPGLQIIYDKLKGDVERSYMEANLLRSDKLASLGRLMAGLSHEMRNPMTTILANAQLLLRGPFPPEETKEMLEDIAHCVQHSVELLNELLIFSRKSPKELRPHPIDDIVGKALKLFGKRFERSGMRIVIDIPPDSPAILCDATQIQQVLVNIISNAQQAMSGEGTLTLTASVMPKDAFLSRQAEAVKVPLSETDTHPGRLKKVFSENVSPFLVLDIDDTGPGMTPQVRKKLFEPFFTTKEPGKGTGLGLSVSSEILTQHNGILAASDNPAGKGARLTLALPAAPHGGNRPKVP